MDAIIKQVGFKGDFPAFLKFLRTDKQFYATTPQELLDRAAWISKRVDGEIGKFIGTLPRGRFTIVPVPPDIAPFWTSGRGGAGTYWVNTYDLPSRPLYNLPALTLHESAPGHALQGSLAREQGDLPRVPPRDATSPPTAKAGACTARSWARKWASTRRPTRNSAA